MCIHIMNKSRWKMLAVYVLNVHPFSVVWKKFEQEPDISA